MDEVLRFVSTLPDADIMLSGEERPIGSLGIFMVKNMLDEMKYVYSQQYIM